jgi:hypothetical protein
MRMVKMNKVLWDLYSDKQIEKDYDAFDEFPLKGAIDRDRILLRRLERQYIRNLILQDGLANYF